MHLTGFNLPLVSKIKSIQNMQQCKLEINKWIEFMKSFNIEANDVENLWVTKDNKSLNKERQLSSNSTE